MPAESDKWGWKHVSVFGGFDKGSGTKRWKCNHCDSRYNGSYSRVRAHLLGFTGVGVKSCPAVDRSLREAFQILEEERIARKKKKASGNEKPTKRVKSLQYGLTSNKKAIGKEVVDDLVARFIYADGLSINVINSPYFQEMTKAIAAFGSSYELPSTEMLSGSLLSKEKDRIDRSVALIRESWPHTGCTISCVGRLDGTRGCLLIKIFVASQRGVAFMTAVDINDGTNLENVFVDVLGNTIAKVGSTNVLQIIPHLGRDSKFSESLFLTRFPHIFWSPCTSSSIGILMDAFAELDCLKPVVLYAKDIEQYILAYQPLSSCMFSQSLEGNIQPYSTSLASSYRTVQRILLLKQSLQDIVVSEEWKRWKHNVSDNIQNIEAAIMGDEFWSRAHSYMQLCEPFVGLLATLDVEKSVMGDVHYWRVQALEALRMAGTDDVILNQLESVIESRWDELFSPLHAAGYILNPRFFGKGQNKDKIVMRGWKAVLDKYECESTARRVIREELSSYWRLEGSFGEEDAVDCRDKMDPVAWWENFGFETPHMQTLAIKVLSQVPTTAVSQEIWRANDLSFQGVGGALSGIERVDDLVFVQNSLRLQTERSGFLSFSTQGDVNSNSPSTDKAWDIAHLDQTKAIVSDYQKQ